VRGPWGDWPETQFFAANSRRNPMSFSWPAEGLWQGNSRRLWWLFLPLHLGGFCFFFFFFFFFFLFFFPRFFPNSNPESVNSGPSEAPGLLIFPWEAIRLWKTLLGLAGPWAGWLIATGETSSEASLLFCPRNFRHGPYSNILSFCCCYFVFWYSRFLPASCVFLARCPPSIIRFC